MTIYENLRVNVAELDCLAFRQIEEDVETYARMRGTRKAWEASPVKNILKAFN